jgi:Zn-dependent membrane protease YugP
MFWIDPLYVIVVLVPGLLLAGGASLLVNIRFRRYSQVANRHGFTGAQAAKVILDRAGIYDVEIVQTHGFLGDHYNPMTKELALSQDVYAGRSLAAVGVAAHEAGHALQHASGYAPLWLRSALVPLAGIGSNLGYIVMFVGLMLSMAVGQSIGQVVVMIGALLFGATLLFQVVTLPVEFDASARAKRLVVQTGVIDPDERYGIDKVLNAAALTYVAAVITTLLTLLYFLLRSGILGGSDD